MILLFRCWRKDEQGIRSYGSVFTAGRGCIFPGLRAFSPQPTSLLASPLSPLIPIILTAQSYILISFIKSGRAQTIHNQVNKQFANQSLSYSGDEYRVRWVERQFDTKKRSGIPGLYEINPETNRKDIFVTIQQAGSPLTGEMCYPLKGVYAVDNTCRVAFGYHPTGCEPGNSPLTEPSGQPDEPLRNPLVPNFPQDHTDPGPEQ